MTEYKEQNLIEILEYIDPVKLDYQEWVNVGMALKHSGYTAADWDAWSKKTAKRYHPASAFRSGAALTARLIRLLPAPLFSLPGIRVGSHIAKKAMNLAGMPLSAARRSLSLLTRAGWRLRKSWSPSSGTL
jgi:hypothetical protein